MTKEEAQKLHDEYLARGLVAMACMVAAQYQLPFPEKMGTVRCSVGDPEDMEKYKWEPSE